MKTSKLWLRNTSRYSSHEVWPLIKAAYESVERSLAPGQVMPRIVVKLTNCCWSFRGRAHWEEWHTPGCKASTPQREGGYGRSEKWLRILVRIGKPHQFPVHVRYPTFKTDMPEYDCQSYREGIVMVTAHEMEHCLGASGRQHGEFRCEMTAWDAIDFYRKHQAEIESEIATATNRIAQRVQEKTAREIEAKRPEVIRAAKLKAAQVALGRWQRKHKLATGKVKKYARAVKRYERQMFPVEQTNP